MTKPTDLRTSRLIKGLTQEALVSGIMRIATLQEIETGKRLPRKKTRNQIESLIGKVDWSATLSQDGDRDHLFYALSEFVQLDQPGAQARIYFCRQALQLLSENLTNKK